MYTLNNIFGGGIAYFCALVAVFGLILQGVAYQLQQNEVYVFVTYTYTNLEELQLVKVALVVANLIGMASVFCSAFVVASLFRKNTFHVWLGHIIIAGISLSTLVLGGTVLFLLSSTSGDVEGSAGFSEDSVREDSFPTRLNEFSLSLYSSCCEQRNFLEETDLTVEACREGDSFFNMQRGDNCFRSKSLHELYLQLGNEDTCSLLQSAVVDFTGIVIPGTNIPVTSFTKGGSRVTLVGPSSDPVFGCGSGFPVAFQFGMLVWVSDHLLPLGLTATIIGGFELVVLVGGFLLLAPGNDEDDDVYSEEERKLKEKRKKKREDRAIERESQIGSMKNLEPIGDTTSPQPKPSAFEDILGV